MFTDLTLPLYSYVSLMFNLIVSSIMAEKLLECVFIFNQCNCIQAYLHRPRHFFTIRSLIHKNFKAAFLLNYVITMIYILVQSTSYKRSFSCYTVFYTKQVQYILFIFTCITDYIIVYFCIFCLIDFYRRVDQHQSE